MVTLISLHLESKSLLRKEIYVNFEKNKASQKWRQIQMKSVPLDSKWSKPL
jgi:hypothetical protein